MTGGLKRGSAGGSRAIAAAASALLVASVAAAQSTTLSLRGGLPPIAVEVAAPSAAGIELRGGEAARAGTDGIAFAQTVPLDLVSAIEGRDRALFTPELARIAEDLWRARTRLERGDAALAQPLIDRHWDRYRDASGPTAALVAEGRLRCALARGDIAGAVEPWLACLRHREAGIPTRFPKLAPALDADTGLLPVLSPFAPSEQRAVVIAAFEAAGTRAESAEISRLLLALARGGASASSGEPRRPSTASAGTVRALELLAQIAGASEPAALDRAVGAFDALAKDSAEPAGPLPAWRLAAIGTGRARIARGVADPARRATEMSRAALDLLAVPASGLDRTGLVDAYALETAALLMRESGEPSSAAQLEALARSGARATP